jgi:hypothetical protein
LIVNRNLLIKIRYQDWEEEAKERKKKPNLTLSIKEFQFEKKK